MNTSDRDIAARAARYAESRGIQLESRLGFGKDGSVWATDRATAVKVFHAHEAYLRELAVYHRLAEHAIRSIRGHQIPDLHDVDDDHLVLEMTTVQPPYLLDFAGAYLDSDPDFGAEVIEQ